MCRFVLYLGDPITMDTLVTLPAHSLIHQSFQSKEREEPLNGDGFGVAWYAPELSRTPAVFRHVSPAWSNRNLYDLSRVTRSHCILAHIRAASPGLPVMETNCHPFREGRFSFMHNGYIPDFRKMKRRLVGQLSDLSYQKILGSTDSEHIFAIFLDEFRELSVSEDAEGSVRKEAMAKAMQSTIQRVVGLMKECEIEAPCFLNLAVSDGEQVVASRYTSGVPERANTLYLHVGKRYVCVDGVCMMEEPDKEKGAFLVASEPLGGDPGWEAIPPNSLVLGDVDMNTEIRPC